MANNWGNNTLTAMLRGGTELTSRLIVILIFLFIGSAFVVIIAQALGVSTTAVMIGIPVIFCVIVALFFLMAMASGPSVPRPVSERRKQGWIAPELTKAETSGDIEDDIVRLLKIDESTNFATIEGLLNVRRSLMELQGLKIKWEDKYNSVEKLWEDIRLLLVGIIPLPARDERVGLNTIREGILKCIELQHGKSKPATASRTHKKRTIEQ